ncbi:Shedu anti-phage system protein SduA domain-containing protein [Vreelandella glaciei]|uniref:Shedu anti-phage system protein SduA domain-containing protein n=1 Tax=Vreelandella glaciei TaxID=186761 RepID=UPI0030EC03BC|tara:strand:+ start:3477 stop:4556 length:1080 start_codon:yes stop_codon:yes gene_type:complete
MWEAIAYVSSGFTLAAFIAAAVAWILNKKSEEKGRLIELADSSTKALLVQDALEFFHVNSDNLNKEQQFNLALEQIKNRASRFKTIAILVGLIAVLATALSAYAISKMDNSSNNGSPAVPSLQEKSISRSEIFEGLISGLVDVNEIRQFIDDNRWMLGGAPVFISGLPEIESVRDFPVEDGFVPNFTRFIFQPRMSQVPDHIIFFDFYSPDLDIFDSSTFLTEHINDKIFRMQKYISSGHENYNEYTDSAAKLANFSIPLSTMQGHFRARFQGVIVVGRRGRLSVQQIEYLSALNKDRNNDVIIITYDTLLEYARLAELYTIKGASLTKQIHADGQSGALPPVICSVSLLGETSHQLRN